MKVRFRESGGFAGLRRVCELDTAAMPAGEATWLERLVRQSGVDGAPPRRPHQSARDLTCYEITVEDGERVVTATLDDLSAPRDAAPLLEFLRERACPEKP